MLLISRHEPEKGGSQTNWCIRGRGVGKPQRYTSHPNTRIEEMDAQSWVRERRMRASECDTMLLYLSFLLPVLSSIAIQRDSSNEMSPIEFLSAFRDREGQKDVGKATWYVVAVSHEIFDNV